MKVTMDSTNVILNPGDAALVFRTEGSEVYVANPVVDDVPVSDPSMMVAILATMTSERNRDLWAELKARFDHDIDAQDADLTQRVGVVGIDATKVMGQEP